MGEIDIEQSEAVPVVHSLSSSIGVKDFGDDQITASPADPRSGTLVAQTADQIVGFAHVGASRDPDADSSSRVRAYLDQLAELVGAGTVLELGSGPGWDAAHLESRGLRVVRTDAVYAFVELLRAGGYPARLLDVRVDDFGGPYDAVLANAVLPHLPREQFADVLGRARRAVADHGVLAFTLKEGDGDRWSHAKLGYLAISRTGEKRPYEARLRATAGRFCRLST